MNLTLNTNICINALSFKPEIIIWHAKIPEIIKSICRKNTYHNSRPMVNQIFQKHDFDPAFLNSEEIKTVNGFKALKKQTEWFCGRYLIKELLHTVFFKETPLSGITISHLEQGAPIVENMPDIPISISHSYDCTTTACSADKTLTFGIDTEKIADKPDAWFLKTAFTQNEIEHLDDTADHIFKNWTIKEAYLKYIKKGFNESLQKVEVIHNTIYHHGRKMDLDVSSQFLDGYVISLVSDKQHIK